MERINLNIPSEMRTRLKAVAASRGRTEAEVARELLIHAVEEAEREAWYHAVEVAHRDPTLAQVHLELLARLEAIDEAR